MTVTRAQILTQLRCIEVKHQITIFFAAESGSRAWGYASLDSDYDVRFLYHHSPTWYISAFQKRDTLDWAMIHNIDLAGWDIAKCIKLLHKGNASLYEWLASPTVYCSDQQKVAPLVELAGKAFNTRRLFNHYFFLGKKRLNNSNKMQQGKWFLYTLRELLSACWIRDTATVPPGDIEQLFERYITDSMISKRLQQFILDKTARFKAEAPATPQLLIDFCHSVFCELEENDARNALSDRHLGDTQAYDDVMRDIILKQQ